MRNYYFIWIACCIGILYFIGSSTNIFAQDKSTYNWACGDSIGITFNTEPPSFFPCKNSCDPIWTTSRNGNNLTISDSSGRLLFYFQGKFVQYKTVGEEIHFVIKGRIFNGLHEVIENGDSIIAAIDYVRGMVVRQPGSDKIYYLFTVGLDYFPNIADTNNFSRVTLKQKLYYHIVDMSANNGNGKVISKNNELINKGTFSGPSIVKHANGLDWWILTHESDSSKSFIKFILTKNGLIRVPNQEIGSIFDPNFKKFKENIDLTTLSLKGGSAFLKNGSKYTIATASGSVEVYDYDRCTACLHNRKDFSEETIYAISDPVLEKIPTDAIFSPNGKNLFVNFVSFIYQYDLETGKKEMVDSSWRYFVYKGIKYPIKFGRFIYHPKEDKIILPDFAPFIRFGIDTLGIINNPDGGFGKIDHRHQWLLSPEKRNFCYGFPYYPNYSLGPLIPTQTRSDTVICRRTELSLGSDHECPYNYSWSGMKVRDSTVKILTHEFDSTGVYKFWRHRYSIAQGCTTAIDTFMVIVKTTAPPCATALEEHSKPKTKVKIYPNPAQEVVMIAANQRILLIRFYDMNGKVVKEEIPATSTQTFESDVQHLPHGIYLLQVETDGGSATQKVVVE